MTNINMTNKNQYRFEHFNMGIMLGDIRFAANALKTNGVLPNVEVYTSDSRLIKIHELASKKALLLITGSLTCPMTVSSLPDLKTLEDEFGEDITFALVYVREAHPGKNVPQPQLLSDKIANAKSLKQIHSVNWQVIIDDIDGFLHYVLDTKPNSVHLINQNGEILFQSLWAGDASAIKRALSQISNNSPVTAPMSQKMMGPFLRGAGYMDEALNTAGRGAYKELILGAPPIAILSKLASLFSFLPQRFRGYATSFILLAIVIFGLVGLM